MCSPKFNFFFFFPWVLLWNTVLDLDWIWHVLWSYLTHWWTFYPWCDFSTVYAKSSCSLRMTWEQFSDVKRDGQSHEGETHFNIKYRLIVIRQNLAENWACKNNPPCQPGTSVSRSVGSNLSQHYFVCWESVARFVMKSASLPTLDQHQALCWPNVVPKLLG